MLESLIPYRIDASDDDSLSGVDRTPAVAAWANPTASFVARSADIELKVRWGRGGSPGLIVLIGHQQAWL